MTKIFFFLVGEGGGVDTGYQTVPTALTLGSSSSRLWGCWFFPVGTEVNWNEFYQSLQRMNFLYFSAMNDPGTGSNHVVSCAYNLSCYFGFSFTFFLLTDTYTYMFSRVFSWLFAYRVTLIDLVKAVYKIV
jgi:hypothetical protein